MGNHGSDGHDQHEGSGPQSERLDRNYNELLQELRVAQTGVQILFAFLLTIAFQGTFDGLTSFQHRVYLATLLSSALSVIAFIAPVATHRMMFRRGLKDRIVALTSKMAMTGIVFLALAILGVVLLVIDVAAGRTIAVIITVAVAVAIILAWAVIPAVYRNLDRGADVADLPDENDNASVGR